MLHMPADADERWKVYGPYTAKDGRQRVVIVEKCRDGTTIKETRSYPKYLAEERLAIMLEPDETVDHLDYNPLNNDPENIRIVTRKDHCKRDATHAHVEPVSCAWCGNSFTPSVSQRNARPGIAGPFCGPSCRGKYGKSIQEGAEALDYTKVEKTYYKPKERM